MGNYADPNIEDCEFLVRVRYASDPLHDKPFTDSFVRKLQELAEAEGVDLEVVTKSDIAAALTTALQYDRAGVEANRTLANKLARHVTEYVDWDPPLRFAVVTAARDSDEVAAYLPDGYHVAGEHFDGDGRRSIVICGQDEAGWTLDGYLIPRLASGLLQAREVTQAEALQLVDGDDAPLYDPPVVAS